MTLMETQLARPSVTIRLGMLPPFCTWHLSPFSAASHWYPSYLPSSASIQAAYKNGTYSPSRLPQSSLPMALVIGAAFCWVRDWRDGCTGLFISQNFIYVKTFYFHPVNKNSLMGMVVNPGLRQIFFRMGTAYFGPKWPRTALNPPYNKWELVKPSQLHKAVGGWYECALCTAIPFNILRLCV